LEKAEKVTTPQELAIERAMEAGPPSQPDQQQVTGRIWLGRIIGLVLLAGALIVLAISGGSFAISAIVMLAFAGYVFALETQARRMTLALEKRLRMSLLVHNMELENMAMQDDLTHLFNRRYFFDRLERELETARAFNRPLSVMVVDLDGMKQINDGYGHRAGDDLLAGFGRFLLGATRASDIPARTGGDEFAIILPDTPDHAAVSLKDRLLRKLSEAELVEGQKVTATASFGVASFPAAGATVDALLQSADVDMYNDKNMRKAERDRAESRAS
jgi:diguanylate cyclase (GGDEF)-like protein